MKGRTVRLGATPLMYACQQGKGNQVYEIIKSKPEAALERERSLKTALHYCAESGSAGVESAIALLQTAPELVSAQDENGYTALHLAVIAGNLALSRLLIRRGALVNCPDSEGHSALHWATVCGETDCLELLLDSGGDPDGRDSHGGTPLHYAAQMCGPGGEMPASKRLGMAALRLLVERGADPNLPDNHGRQPILWAASAGSSEAILVLTNAGASVEAADKDGLTALHCAASRGHVDCLETLVSLCGAEADLIDHNGCSALFYAVTLGHADCTRALLNHGALTGRQDRKGRTAMHCGAAKGQLETLRLIWERGGNLWLRTARGDYPLHEAVAAGRAELVLWLLSLRPDAVDAPNNDGRCPLHVAALRDNVDMCKVLLDAGSMVNPVMRTGKGLLATPLDAALQKGHRGTAKFLQLHGGVPAGRLNSESAALRGSRNSGRRPREGLEGETPVPVKTQSQHQKSANIKPLPSKQKVLQVYVEDGVMIKRIKHPQTLEDERVRRRRRKRKTRNLTEKALLLDDSTDEGGGEPIRVSSILEKPLISDSEPEIPPKQETDDNKSSEVLKSLEARLEPQDSEDTKKIVHEVFVELHEPPHEAKELIRDKRDAESPILTKQSSDNLESQNLIKTDVSLNTDNSQEKKEDVKQTDNETEQNEISIPETLNKEIVEELITKTSEEAENSITEIKEIITEEEEAEKMEKEPDQEEIKKIEKEHDTEKIKNQVQETENIVESEIDEASTTEKISDVNSEIKISVDAEINKNLGESDANIEFLEHEIKAEVSETIEELKETDASLHSLKINDEKSEEKDEFEKVEKSEIQDLAKEDNVEEKLFDKNTDSTETVVHFSEEVLTKQESSEQIRSKLKTEEGNDVDYSSDEDFAPDIEDLGDSGKTVDKIKEIDEDYERRWSDSDEKSIDEKLKHIEDQIGIPQENESKTAMRTGIVSTGEGGSAESKGLIRVLEGESGPPTEASQRSRTKRKEWKRQTRDGDNWEPVALSPSENHSKFQDPYQLQDSGIEPSPQMERKHGFKAMRPKSRSRIPRMCNNKNQNEFEDDLPLSTVSVTQAVQYSVRKYHLERRIFHQLLELKRLQIRAGRSSEGVLVKRLVDDYRRAGLMLGLRQYTGVYTFRAFERYLYDQLRLLQSSERRIIPRLKSSDDLERLNSALRKSRVGQELLTTVPSGPASLCVRQTHRCHHATHAYTGIPCAAYIRRDHHTMPKPGPFLPRLVDGSSGGDVGRSIRFVDPATPLTLELSHGSEKQVITLPTEKLDKSKRYFVTFTIKSGSAKKIAEPPKHTHASSV